MTGLIEAEEAVPGEGEGMWRLCPEYAVVAALEYRPPGGFRAGPPAEV